MILSHARLPIPTLPQIGNSQNRPEDVNQMLTKMLTSDMVSAFTTSRRQGISRHTVLFYQRCLSKAIGMELTPQGISSFLANLDCGNAKHSYFRAIRALCNWAEGQGHIQSNPIKRVDSPKVAKKLLPSVTSGQLDTLLDATDSLREKAMVSLLFDNGLRLSELASIQSKDIDWSNNTLRVVVKGNREAKAAFTSNTAILIKDIYLITVTTRRCLG